MLPSRPTAVLALVAVLSAGVALAAKPSQRLSDQARGQQLYGRHCVGCHGESAAGDGPVASALQGQVPDLTGAMSPDTQSDQVDVILAGRAFMPAYSLSMDRYDARRVWRHMKRLANGETIEADTDADTDTAEE